MEPTIFLSDDRVFYTAIDYSDRILAYEADPNF